MDDNKKWGLSLQCVQGMGFPLLLRVLAAHGFRVDARRLDRLAYLVVAAACNSVLDTCANLVHGRAAAETEIRQPPLFVIGHWRSGTTHLHNLLSLDEALSAPGAFQAMFPGHFLISQIARAVFDFIAPGTRPMDNVAFFADAPHEDEFAIAASCAVSPYLRIWFPASDPHPCSALDPRKIPEEDLQRWKGAMLGFAKRLTMTAGRRLVLKSPPHMGRVSTLLEVFPGARFVHIVRNPYEVYSSTVKLWRDAFAYSHLQVAEWSQIDEMILSWYEELFALFERDRPAIPAGALHELKFEDLERDPVAILEDVYHSLDLPGWEAAEVAVRRYVDSLRNYEKNCHRLDDASGEKIAARWAAVFGRYGYPK
jgi:omega-hydroxy-beta-dihydromenaquinone-9 sulfotransferase